MNFKLKSLISPLAFFTIGAITGSIFWNPSQTPTPQHVTQDIARVLKPSPQPTKGGTKPEPRRHFAGAEKESSPRDPKLRSLTKTVLSAIPTYIAEEKPVDVYEPDIEANFTTPPLRLDDTFVSELPDPDWSEQAESKIKDLLTVSNVDTTVVEMRCKTTLCRIKLNLEDISAEDAAIALSRLPGPGESYVHLSRQGEAVFYVVRDGLNIHN